eukprot:m.180403 g.180403  ORF g.180403 m.180403 type:complete len:422 (-) comp18014_c0_seq4:232-1497(-)
MATCQLLCGRCENEIPSSATFCPHCSMNFPSITENHDVSWSSVAARSPPVLEESKPGPDVRRHSSSSSSPRASSTSVAARGTSSHPQKQSPRARANTSSLREVMLTRKSAATSLYGVEIVKAGTQFVLANVSQRGKALKLKDGVQVATINKQPVSEDTLKRFWGRDSILLELRVKRPSWVNRSLRKSTPSSWSTESLAHTEDSDSGHSPERRDTSRSATPLHQHAARASCEPARPLLGTPHRWWCPKPCNLDKAQRLESKALGSFFVRETSELVRNMVGVLCVHTLQGVVQTDICKADNGGVCVSNQRTFSNLHHLVYYYRTHCFGADVPQLNGLILTEPWGDDEVLPVPESATLESAPLENLNLLFDSANAQSAPTLDAIPPPTLGAQPVLTFGAQTTPTLAAHPAPALAVAEDAVGEHV